jgi:hypothetical protein
MWTRSGSVVLVKGVVVLALGVCLMVLSAFQAGGAHAAAVTAQAQTPLLGQGCARLRVHLNGDQIPTVTCLLTEQQARSRVTPLIQQSSCDPADLQLFDNNSYGGDEICFNGTGHLNLDHYYKPVLSNWNDKVSSYKTGQWYGHFSWDNDNGGPHHNFSDHWLCSWIGSYWNDEISYVQLDGTGNHSQEFC